MRRGYLVIFGFVLFFVAMGIGSQAYGGVLYDDFSGIYINKDKWKYGELVREIDSGTQKLLLKMGSPNPIVVSSYPYSSNNNLIFFDPNSVNSFQADVAISNFDITNNAHVRARIFGTWYNDGTSGSGYIGDIGAGVDLWADASGLYATWYVADYTNAAGTTWTLLGSGKFTTPISLGTPYTLFISYDNIANQFTFKIGGESKTFVPSVANLGSPKTPLKILNTLHQIDDASSKGYISASFDNVYKNGSLYDDFSSPTIDQNKWTPYEFVREISGGKLRSKIRTNSNVTASAGSILTMTNPSSTDVIQAKMTLSDYENSQGIWATAGSWADVYNDGTPGGGYIGDVVGRVVIGGGGMNPVAIWSVYKYIDMEGKFSTTVASGTFVTPIALGGTYTLYLAWNGHKFTFKIDNEEATYTPVTSINPANFPFKWLGTAVTYGVEATIEALFDDVIVNPSMTDFNADGKPDILWRNTSTGENYVWYMDGVTFLGSAALFTVNPVWQIVGVGDFNGDTKPDILWRNSSTGENYVWYMNGVTFIGSAPIMAVSDQNWKIVGVGDFNGDTKPDILWRNTSTGENYVWYMNGVTFNGSAPVMAVSDQNWKIVGVGDFNGDSKPDILWRNSSTGENYVWYMNGVTFIGSAPIMPVSDQNWKIVGVGDFNGDTKPDILWRNTSTGENYVWYMDGATFLGSAALFTVGDQNWQIVGR